MKREISRHADDFRCGFTIEFCVKNPSFPESVDEKTARFEFETGAFTNQYGDECFKEITKGGQLYRWMKDWSFAGRSNGWFALICDGEPECVREKTLDRIQGIVEKYYREYGEKLAAFYADEFNRGLYSEEINEEEKEE